MRLRSQEQQKVVWTARRDGGRAGKWMGGFGASTGSLRQLAASASLGLVRTTGVLQGKTVQAWVWMVETKALTPLVPRGSAGPHTYHRK